MSIRKVLIANRGEIACRIARTCRRLGLQVATVHSTVDRDARHVREIGESIEVGGAAAADSYLDIAAIVAAARAVGADAVHPGYGFLSENADFVRALDAAGLCFIGPTAETIERLGGKARAKAEAARIGVPVIAGSAGGVNDPEAIERTLRQMQLPMLLKAVAGGGGRGMAVIDTLDGVAARIEGAMREARQSFGNGELIVERYLPKVRHLEVQVAGDGQGRAIHLYERECTLQRRHQKLIEEAPSSGLSPTLRQALLDDAVRIAEAVHYRGLGTVEFVVAGDSHYFLEVNPRLQVEHPVTEAVAGLDLVQLQLEIADSGRLPLTQSQVRCDGHAFEARLCAEDVDAGFLPATGRVQRVAFSRAAARIESGVESGDAISPWYDSMIAKLITHADDRDAARRALVGALRDSTVLGLATNLHFLQELLEWPETRDGSFHTRLIDERVAQRANTAEPPPDAHLLAAALHWLAQRRSEAPDLGCWTSHDGFTGWRLGGAAARPAPQPALVLRADGGEWPIRYARPEASGSCAIAIGDRAAEGRLQPIGNGRHLLHAGARTLEVMLHGDATKVEVASALGSHVFDAAPFLGGAAGTAAADGQLGAPMMGKVVAVRVASGDAVTAGQSLVVLESMKMELHVAAPFDGRVAHVRCQVGQMVERHQVLVAVSAAAA